MLQMFQLLSDSNDISIDSFHVIYDSDVTVFLNWSGSVSLIWLRSFCCWEMGNNNLFFKNSLNLSLAAGLQHCWSARMEMTIRCIFCQLCGLVWQLIMEEDALEAMKKYLIDALKTFGIRKEKKIQTNSSRSGHSDSFPMLP